MYLGHDAEFAVVGPDGKVKPAHRWFPPKDAPIFTDYRRGDDGGHRDQIFRDGTNLEVNTPGNISCIGTVLASTMHSLRAAKRLLPRGYRLDAISSYEVEGDVETFPGDVLETGCSPAKNAYEGWRDIPAFVPYESKLRCAGGHIHMSMGLGLEGLRGDALEARCSRTVQWLDAFLAVPVIYMGLEGAAGTRRRQFYGKAGEYRFQQYTTRAYTNAWGTCIRRKRITPGIEYRVLGPEWLRHRGLAAFTLMLARSVAIASRKSRKLGVDHDEVRAAINTGEVTRLWESAAYQEAFGNMLRDAGFRARYIRVEAIEFLHENAQMLFPRLDVPMKWVNPEWTWPELWPGWMEKVGIPEEARVAAMHALFPNKARIMDDIGEEYEW